MHKTVEQKKLSIQLMELCDQHGTEDIYNLEKSSKIIDKIGVLLRSNSPDKISLVRCAGCFNAAICRWPENYNLMKHLEDLCSLVLVEANSKRMDADLIKISTLVRAKVSKMRDKTRESLSLIPIIPSGLPQDQLKKAEVDKIERVRKLQNEISSQYTEIMAYVSNKCELIMGDPPCKFSILGMGSLARKEITPFSDFEHAIILEDEVKHKENYEEILEYFRWFSVIFHIIVINLGETVLRNLALPFINNDAAPGWDWYFDSHTPCGIRFDGMQKSAWMFPLGKPGGFELIKTVQDMLKYVEEEKDENGYLPYILTDTCFVYGNKNLYHRYAKKLQKIVQAELNQQNNKLPQRIKQLMKHLQNFGALNMIRIHFHAICNVKNLLYRSSTLFISFLGRLIGLRESSCFEIVDKLQHFVSNDAVHKLLYAIAISCEARQKVYMCGAGQYDLIGEKHNKAYDFIELAQLESVLGEQSLGDYFVIVQALQLRLHSFLTDGKLDLADLDYPTHEKAFTFLFLNLRCRLETEWQIFCAGEKSNLTTEVALRYCLFHIHRPGGDLDDLDKLINMEVILGKVLQICDDLKTSYESTVSEYWCFDEAHVNDLLYNFGVLWWAKVICLTDRHHFSSAWRWCFLFFLIKDVFFDIPFVKESTKRKIEARIYLAEAWLHLCREENSNALVCVENIINYFESTISVKPNAIAEQSYEFAAKVLLCKYDFSGAAKHIQKVLEHKHLISDYTLSKQVWYRKLGNCYQHLNKPFEALICLTVALKIALRSVQKDQYDCNEDIQACVQAICLCNPVLFKRQLELNRRYAFVNFFKKVNEMEWEKTYYVFLWLDVQRRIFHGR